MDCDKYKFKIQIHFLGERGWIAATDGSDPLLAAPRHDEHRQRQKSEICFFLVVTFTFLMMFFSLSLSFSRALPTAKEWALWFLTMLLSLSLFKWWVFHFRFLSTGEFQRLSFSPFYIIFSAAREFFCFPPFSNPPTKVWVTLHFPASDISSFHIEIRNIRIYSDIISILIALRD